ncbi:MAG: hypothetical protein WCF35_24400, partial [Pseudolabrys sp.]
MPLVLVTRIGAFDYVSPHFHLQDQVHDVPERHIAGMWTRPAAPADVIANTVGRQAFDRVIENVDLVGQPTAVIDKTCGRHHTVE